MAAFSRDKIRDMIRYVDGNPAFQHIRDKLVQAEAEADAVIAHVDRHLSQPEQAVEQPESKNTD